MYKATVSLGVLMIFLIPTLYSAYNMLKIIDSIATVVT